MNRLAVFLCLCTIAAVGLHPQKAISQAAVAKPQTFRLELNAEQQKMPSWIILVQSDGKGLYWPTLTSKYGQVPVHLSESTWQRVHGGVAAIEGNRCETKLKHIAKTGVKDVDYQGGATGTSDATCTFNYSDDAELNDAVAALEGMVSTMQMGEKLQHSLRYDRLGLDAQMDSFVEEVKAGRAIEVQNIAPVLKSIVDDERVLERVRRKAARLLQDASTPAPQLPSPTAR